MKFFWPAPLDLIDPSFDFIHEKGLFGGAKQKSQLFPHEVFDVDIYDGFVISKIYVEKNYTRWNASQLNRFFREGAKKFLRLPKNSSLEVMGDSGAFTRSSSDQINKPVIDECLDVIGFYSSIGVDYGLSPDNLIGGFLTKSGRKIEEKQEEEWRKRWKRTILLAESFLNICKKKNVKWHPVGVAQGWDKFSYQESVKALQNMGYSYIALGGLNSLKSTEIISVLESCNEVRSPSTDFHLLGISRIDCSNTFISNGVISFDSAMPLRQAIYDGRHNYHLKEDDYLAIRVPQTYQSPRLRAMISEGALSGKDVIEIENNSLNALRKYDLGECSIDTVLDVLQQGISYRKEKDYSRQYKKLLTEMPWKKCNCKICQEIGIEVVILRNRERNLRRGFHNLYVFSKELKQLSLTTQPTYQL